MNPFHLGPLPRDLGRDEARARLADRTEEVAAASHCMESPASRLVLYGPRRMGKSWVLGLARIVAESKGVWSASVTVPEGGSPGEVGAQVLQDLDISARGDKRKLEVLQALLRGRLHSRVEGDPASRTGNYRPYRPDDRMLFFDVLQALNESLERQNGHAALVVDEYQFLGASSEELIRATLKSCERLSIVLSGSDRRIGEQVASPSGCLYGVAKPQLCSAIDEAVLATWIIERAGKYEVVIELDAAQEIVRAAGPTTWNIVRLAGAAWSAGRDLPLVEVGNIREIVAGMVATNDRNLRRNWRGLDEATRRLLSDAAHQDLRLPGLVDVADARRVESLLEGGRLVERDGLLVVEDFELRAWLAARAP